MELFSEKVQSSVFTSTLFNNYAQMGSEKYKKYFFEKLEILVLDKLPIETENIKYTDDKILYKNEIRKFEYVENEFFPTFSKIVAEHKTYLEIEAIQLKYNRKEELVVDFDNRINLGDKKEFFDPYEKDGK